MTEARLYGVDIKNDPVEDLRAWIHANNVKALVVVPNFINSYPEIWHAIEASQGTLVKLELVADPGSNQVFVVME
jgi:hypothetical protein